MDNIFDEALIVSRKLRALAQPVSDADFIMRRTADDLADRLSLVQRRFERAAAIHCGTRHAADVMLGSGKIGSVVRIEAEQYLAGPDGLASTSGRLPLEPESLDLIVSVLGLHEVNDLPGFFIQARRALRPDGLLLAAFAGAGTLGELRESLLAAEAELTGGASARVSPFADVKDAGALLQRAGFALPVADLETITVRYENMFGLMADLRGMGSTSALANRSRRPPGRQLFARAAQIYAQRFADGDGRIRATFCINWVSGWAPHESQQKPLKPGSAAMPLKKALDGN